MADAARTVAHAARSSGSARSPLSEPLPVRLCGGLGLAVTPVRAAGTQLKLSSLLRREEGGLMSPYPLL